MFLGECMFDKLWPWIRFKSLSDHPPGFRIAPTGSIGGANGITRELPGPDSGISESAHIDLGGVYRPAGRSGNPYGSFDPLAVGFDPIRFGGRPSSLYATSLLFPQLTELQASWPDSEGFSGQRDAQTDTPVLGFTPYGQTNRQALASPPALQRGTARQTIPSRPSDSTPTLMSRHPQASAPTMQLIMPRTVAIRSGFSTNDA